MNFTQLIILLYNTGEITFDDDGALNLSPLAVIDIQRHIKPMSILNLDLDGTLAMKAIRATHEAAMYQEANNKRIECHFKDARTCDDIKHALYNAGLQQPFGVH